MYRAVDVAWKMLKVAHSKGIQLSHLQLQKLVYIAHGYLLGWKLTPLIQENVEAWNYGPVISSIYHEFKECGDNKIILNNNAEFATELDNDADACAVISGVLDLYGRLDAMHLVNLTHQANTPWDDAWNIQGGRQYYSYPIDNELIKNHYRKVLANPTAVGGL
ncbi:Panacea domain-containing protein [Aeromonas veronii]